ncbi:MAG: hypothetical protein A2Y33_05255 [Spirochaetes bacterium GWF1_51_8]|nr:MAG: hypothetical protein A2Y33_05255 [Spirochaetes bacterium GWF1_51_8]
MKEEYDFSGAEKGKFYIPESEIEIPVYLKVDVKSELTRIATSKKQSVSELVNAILEKELGLL